MQRTVSIKTAQELVGQLELARIQLNQAEARLFAARKGAGLAKRKRKEAKEAHRRAKKEVKRAKGELCTAREAMSKAEADLARAATVRTWEEKVPLVEPNVRKLTKPAPRATGQKNRGTKRIVVGVTATQSVPGTVDK